jgi:hypothetical protein
MIVDPTREYDGFGSTIMKRLPRGAHRTGPRYYSNFLGGAARMGKLVALAPSDYGTTLDGLTALGQQLGLLIPLNRLLADLTGAAGRPSRAV